MGKYIDAEGVMRACYDSFVKTNNKAYKEIALLVEAVPAADVQEVKHGRWIETTVPELWECSVCGCVIYSETEIDRKIYHKWCGRCGARMVNEEK